MSSILHPPTRNDKLHAPSVTEREKVVASNEHVSFARLASVPPARFALAPNAHAQEMHLLRVNSESQCAGVNEGTTHASPALLLSSTIDEHWGLVPTKLAFALNVATHGSFPIEDRFVVARRTDRVTSLEYAVLHVRARLAHALVVLDDLAFAPDCSHQQAHPASELAQLPPIEQGIEFNDGSAFLVAKSRMHRDDLVQTQKPTDPKLERTFHQRPQARMDGNARAFDELEKRLGDLGLLDLRPDGVLDRVLHRSRDVACFDVSVSGVAILRAQFPSGTVAIGEHCFICVICDAWDGDALAAHEPIEEVIAVRNWLERNPNDRHYEESELKAYMDARNVLLYNDDWDAAEASTTRCTLANFRLRLMSSVDLRNATAAARERADAEHGARRKRRREVSAEEVAKEREGRFRVDAAWNDDPKTAPFVSNTGLRRSKCVTERIAFGWNLGKVLMMDPLNGTYTLNVGIYPVTSEQLHRRSSRRGA